MENNETEELDVEIAKLNGELIFNKEQTEAINKGIEFIKSGNEDTYFLIEGKAGTGKTTVIAQILKKYKSKTILACALSHKAKNVIESVLKHNKIDGMFLSIAGALGMDFDIETGRFINGFRKSFERPINKANIIIVDEASMVNEEMIDLIFTYKRKGSKVIFLGDIGQLPPIRSKENEYYYKWEDEELDNISPVFLSGNKVKLLERIRQGEESPILPFADYFWENSQIEEPYLFPTEKNGYIRKSIINSNGSLIFVNKTSNIMNLMLPLFEKSVKNKDHNFIKFITYKNDTKNLINEYIHDKLFPNSTFYNVGESIIFNDNYGDINNSTETEILAISKKEIDKYNIEYYNVTVRFVHKDQLDTIIKCVAFESKEKHEKIVTNVFKLAFKYKGANKEKYNKYLQSAWEYKGRYAKIDYSYSLTSHKAQGSTYNVSIIHEKDINSVMPTSNKAKSQSIYTAITRAKNMAIIISDCPVKNNLNTSKINLLEIEEKISNKEKISLD
jgi:exodeoxyribonuclease-5